MGEKVEKVVTETLNPHSVEITRGANGKTSFSVKGYGPDLQTTLKEAIRIFKKLNSTYPLES